MAVRFASILSPIRRICSGFGPMKAISWSAEDLREAGVLRQEAVAWMHRVRAGDLAGGKKRGNVEIAVARRRGADAHALVGQLDMHGVGVGGRMDGDRRDAELLAGAQDPQRDFAAIGDEDSCRTWSGRGPIPPPRSGGGWRGWRKPGATGGGAAGEDPTRPSAPLRSLGPPSPAGRGGIDGGRRIPHHSITIRGSPNSTGCPSSTRISVTVPERGAAISLKVFIASMSKMRSPSFTVAPNSTNGFASGDGRR